MGMSKFTLCNARRGGGGDAMTPFSTEREKGLMMMMNAGVSPVMDEHPIQGE